MGVLGLKRRMQKARVEVDVVSCNTLLNALAICGKWDEALSFLQVRFVCVCVYLYIQVE